MATEVVMPEVGESVVSGTVVKWLKKVGDEVAMDEPLLEISTDKADVEIPSPGEGVLKKILAEEGDEVEVGGLLAIIAAPDEEIEEKAKPTPKGEEKKKAPPKEEKPKKEAEEKEAPPEKKPKEKRPPKEVEEEEVEEKEIESVAERRRTKSSPLVRRMAKEHGIDLAEIEGSGQDGRVTKEDILDYLAMKEEGKAPARKKPERPPERRRPEEEELEEAVPLEGMRKAIAEHMVRSKHTSPHVTTIAEVDMSKVVALREGNKEAFRQKYGISLSYLAFIIPATIQALKEFPYLNSTLKDDTITLKRYYHMGISVQTERGLMTPVIRNADRLGVEELARTLDSLARRAREGRLSLNEIQGGTFSITNPGFYGAVLSTPIINQPQAAILGTEAIVKRAVVVDDAIAIRPMMYLCLSYDHRIVDGATSIQFLQRVRTLLEEGDFEIHIHV